jgi:hypothetical protein
MEGSVFVDAFLAVAYDVVSSCHPPLHRVLLSSMHAIMGNNGPSLVCSSYRRQWRKKHFTRRAVSSNENRNIILSSRVAEMGSIDWGGNLLHCCCSTLDRRCCRCMLLMLNECRLEGCRMQDRIFVQEDMLTSKMSQAEAQTLR